MSDNIVKFQPPLPNVYEVSGKIKDLIKQAEGCLEYLEENSVGYYYYLMLQELKRIENDRK